MVASTDANIMTERSSTAKIKARIKAGYKVKADFLEGGWYAVFRLDEKERSKKKALGYVQAKRLKAVNQPAPPKAKSAGAKAAFDLSAPPKEIPAGTKFVVDLTMPPQAGAAGASAKPPVPPKASTAGAKAAVAQTAPPRTNTEGDRAGGSAPPPLSEANKAEAKALAEQMLPPKAVAAGAKSAAPAPSPAKAVAVEEKAVAVQQSPPGKNRAEEKAAAAAAVPEDEEGIILRDITFKAGPTGHEKVFIALNRQATPVLSSIQDDSPRVAADFKNVASVRPGLQNIQVGGAFVKRIRSSFNPVTRILRIVLDLDPAKNYLVNQVFSQKENIYAFDLSEDMENPVR